MIRIITSLVAVLTITSVQAQTSVCETPKLIIGITIDQLRGDYLDLFQHSFSERGFKRLLNEGLVYQNINFNFPNIDDASAIATIYTGASPFYNGIIGNRKFLADKQQVVPIFDDNEYIGNYTQDKVSPSAIRTSTITDELKIASRGESDVYSFAPQSSQALITAGRTGNCAFWVEDYSGKWASSTYYKDFHWTVDQENSGTTSYATKAKGLVWSPLLSINNYKTSPYSQVASRFQYDLGYHKDTYKLFKQTPFVNDYVAETSIKLLAKAELGKRSYPDFLSLTFYAGNYPNIDDYSVEIQDLYARLDRSLEKLLDEVDKSIGLKNVLIFIAPTGYYSSNNPDNKSLSLPDNKFYINRCEALLNMYLMAIYGKNDQWVDRFYNGQIYLNRKLIKDRNISLEEIQNKAAEFVTEFSGVQEVYTSYQLQHGEWNPIMEYYRNGFTKETSGDLFVEIQPGYKIVNEKDQTHVEKQIRNNAIICPVIFFGNNIKPQKVNRTIKATEIAPSVTHIMRIRSPNASADEVLPELL